MTKNLSNKTEWDIYYLKKEQAQCLKYFNLDYQGHNITKQVPGNLPRKFQDSRDEPRLPRLFSKKSHTENCSKGGLF